MADEQLLKLCFRKFNVLLAWQLHCLYLETMKALTMQCNTKVRRSVGLMCLNQDG